MSVAPFPFSLEAGLPPVAVVGFVSHARLSLHNNSQEPLSDVIVRLQCNGLESPLVWRLDHPVAGGDTVDSGMLKFVPARFGKFRVTYDVSVVSRGEPRQGNGASQSNLGEHLTIAAGHDDSRKLSEVLSDIAEVMEVYPQDVVTDEELADWLAAFELRQMLPVGMKDSGKTIPPTKSKMPQQRKPTGNKPGQVASGLAARGVVGQKLQLRTPSPSNEKQEAATRDAPPPTTTATPPPPAKPSHPSISRRPPPGSPAATRSAPGASPQNEAPPRPTTRRPPPQVGAKGPYIPPPPNRKTTTSTQSVEKPKKSKIPLFLTLAVVAALLIIAVAIQQHSQTSFGTDSAPHASSDGVIIKGEPPESVQETSLSAPTPPAPQPKLTSPPAEISTTPLSKPATSEPTFAAVPMQAKLATAPPPEPEPIKPLYTEAGLTRQIVLGLAIGADVDDLFQKASSAVTIKQRDRLQDLKTRAKTFLAQSPFRSASEKGVIPFVRLYYAAPDMASLFCEPRVKINKSWYDKGAVISAADLESNAKSVGKDVANQLTGGPTVISEFDNEITVETTLVHSEGGQRTQVSDVFKVKVYEDGYRIVSIADKTPPTNLSQNSETEQIKQLIYDLIGASNDATVEQELGYYATHVTRYFDVEPPTIGNIRSNIEEGRIENKDKGRTAKLSVRRISSVSETKDGWEARFSLDLDYKMTKTGITESQKPQNIVMRIVRENGALKIKEHYNLPLE